MPAEGDFLAVPLLRPWSEARENPNDGGDGAPAANADIANEVYVDPSSLQKRVLVTEAEGLVGDEADWRSNSDDDSDGKSSFWQTFVNFLNIMLGMGMLALPSCVEEAGWLSLSLLLGFAIICYYTGVLFARCLGTDKRIKSYQDIGEAAFGAWGRTLLTAFVVLDIVAYLVGMIISMGDNLARIFPNAGLSLPWFDISLKPSQVLVTFAVLVALPTTWLPDMSSLSFVSFGGVVTSFIVMGSVAWAGVFGGVGFSHSPPRLNLANVPLASGIYGYCFAAHVLLPNIYTGMKNPAQFAKVLLLIFVIAFGFLSGLAILGAVMFGADAQSPITLSIPRNSTVGTIALWTAVLTPISKFGMAVAPLAEQIELFLPYPRHSTQHRSLSIVIRSSLVLAVLAIALALPFFYKMLALTGAAVSLSLSVTFPAALHLKMFKTSLTRSHIIGGALCIVCGVFFSVIGTAASVRALMTELSN